jgi:EAL domain-containing protein (putative c-di-GMP-specific phosphodiesterase class I)
VFAQDMGESSRGRITLETDLRHGIERGELELFYQPKVSLADGRLVGAEALLRWRHPERGLVPPLQFIPLAEETGLIGPIGDWVIDEALRHLRDWFGQGLPLTKIAVNLSARQFRDRDLAARVKAMLAASGVEPRWLELELTETMLMKHGESTVKTLEELRSAGLSLAIDDFGTGYSSLAYLQRFPIDTLKIDRSFVKDLEARPDSCVLAETILMMARNLGKSVVAEGVETLGQADILRRAGCDVVQGFLFSPPVPVGEFVGMLAAGVLAPKARG